mgnify:FL=1
MTLLLQYMLMFASVLLLVALLPLQKKKLLLT